MSIPGVVEFGGEGPGILLLHGLMGRASTWWRVAQWLRAYGRVVGLDARAHGRNPRREPCDTKEFVTDIADSVHSLRLAPVVAIGHSMGGLHALGLAAFHPELVSAVVIEEMAPDQRGKTVAGWRQYFESWPAAFSSIAHVREFFAERGDYFAECVEERADGYHLIADIEAMYAIAEEWGQTAYWSFVDRVRCPLLAIEAENSVTPPGQMSELAARVPGGRHLLVAGAGHVVHDDVPEVYRGAVEAFISALGR